MAARGSVVKEQVAQKILETFPGAFAYEKEIRVPMTENGELIQIKVTLTAAQTNVEGGDVVMSAATVASTPVEAKPVATVIEPSAEEKKTVADLMAKLGL